LLTLLGLALRVDAAPALDPIAEAVRYANVLTGEDPDAAIAVSGPDDPDDQLAGTSSDDSGDSAGGAEADPDPDDDDRSGSNADSADRDAASGETEDTIAEHAGELALLDDAQASAAAITSDDAGFAASSAGAVETYEARMRGRRSWLLGRVDLGLAWRRHLSAPMHAPAHLDHELWLLATWRR